VLPDPISIFMQQWRMRAPPLPASNDRTRTSATVLLLFMFRFVIVSVLLPRRLILTLSRF
jgi:hypothetical protein